tara:strand:- start:340 stop:798 length:459 start_codon:yes stop_codon:yes gene_type:complete
MTKNKSHFKVDWVLVNELAIGPAPKKERHLLMLKENGIKSIFSLCSESEAPPPEGFYNSFECKRFVLPDHKAGRLPELQELLTALDILKQSMENSPVFIHCVAAIERSPLVCMSWLVKEKGLSALNAFEYMKEVHPRTNPLAGQLSLLSNLI